MVRVRRLGFDYGRCHIGPTAYCQQAACSIKCSVGAAELVPTSSSHRRSWQMVNAKSPLNCMRALTLLVVDSAW